jgi:beta-lactamase superfamily II metal-dependent hydrolase
MMLVRTIAGVVLLASALSSTPVAAKTLDMYVIDVGGKASLFVSPSGETMLIDAGIPATVARIVDACKALGVKKIDYMVVSHYDGDHVGGVPPFAAQVPIDTFVDHGDNVQMNPGTIKNVEAYHALTAKAKHLVVKAGDRIPIKGFDALVVMAGGKAIAEPLKGAGQPNPACDTTPRKVWGPNARGVVDNHDTNENSQAIVLLITYGRFRMLDPADLTWNKDRDLFCGVNRVGTVDVYVTANHGIENGNSPVMVNALRPRVVITDNAPDHGASAEVFGIIEAAPGLEDYWQLNYSPAAGEKANVKADFIANAAGTPGGKWLKVSMEKNGTFTVINTGNNFSKTYKPRK